MVSNTKELYSLLHHSSRVGTFGQEIAMRMGLSEDKCMKVFIAGVFHDLGKIFIDDQVISKKTPLTDSEVVIVKSHVSLAVEFLKRYHLDVPLPIEIIKGIEDHHENIDGSGYPHGKVGNEISLIGRILSVVDRFDALTSNRVYRKKAYSFKEAIHILEKESCKLDQEVLGHLIEIIKVENILSHLELKKIAI